VGGENEGHTPASSEFLVCVNEGPMVPLALAERHELQPTASDAQQVVLDDSMLPGQLHRLIAPNERDRSSASTTRPATASPGSAIGARQYALGVDRFGESGTIADLHKLAGIDAGSLVNAALIAVTETSVSAPESPDL
jgi:pyruvate dehydrogenase complex dehydrogenase (E1) component